MRLPYVEYGVLEQIFYNPDTLNFWAFVRNNPDESPTLIMRLNLPWVSPVLGIRFEMEANGLALFYPDGERFTDPQTWRDERDVAQQERDVAQQERDIAQQERNRAWQKLRELGIDPEQLPD